MRAQRSTPELRNLYLFLFSPPGTTEFTSESQLSSLPGTVSLANIHSYFAALFSCWLVLVKKSSVAHRHFINSMPLDTELTMSLCPLFLAWLQRFYLVLHIPLISK